MNKYIKYKISSSPFIPDIISGLMWQLNITGINEDDNSLLVFADKNSGIDETDIEEKLEDLKLQNIINEYHLETEELEDKNWNEIWEMSREVIRISDKVVIKPSFKEYEKRKNEIVLTIDPKMSFGTGEHETTKLVLQLLEKYVQPGMNLLDVGSGTAIISIAAVKLDAIKAVAVDNDPNCYVNAIENCKLNNVEQNVNIYKGVITDIDQNDFDLVCANIQKNILIEIAEKIYNKIKKGGNVILSGLMLKDEQEIIDKYSSIGFSIIEIKYLNEWLAIVLTKK